MPAELRWPALPPVSKAALAALSTAKSVSEKLRSTCQRDRIGAGTKDDESGLAPAEEDDTASADYSRWQACWLLSTDGIHKNNSNRLERTLMLNYAVKRTYGALLVVVAVSLITFVMLTQISGNAAMLALGTDATAEQLAQLEHSLGLDLPWYLQYLNWVKNLFHLDFGTSALYGENVLTLVLQRLPVTLSLAVASMLMALLVAGLLGVASAVKKGSIIDILSRSIMQIGAAIPGFWIGLIFIIYLALGKKWFPASGFVNPGDSFTGYLQSIFLPSLVLAIGEVGPLLRAVRTSMLQSLQQDYILMAKAQGLPAWKIYLKYGLRGALAAPLNVAGMQFAKLLGGTTVVESVFSLPGLGRLVLVAVEQRDIVLLQGAVMFITLAVVLISLLVDLLTAWMNPRIRLNEGGNAA